MRILSLLIFSMLLLVACGDTPEGDAAEEAADTVQTDETADEEIPRKPFREGTTGAVAHTDCFEYKDDKLHTRVKLRLDGEDVHGILAGITKEGASSQRYMSSVKGTLKAGNLALNITTKKGEDIKNENGNWTLEKDDLTIDGKVYKRVECQGLQLNPQ